MEMIGTTEHSNPAVALLAIAVLAASFVLAPLALASSGSDYPQEIARAHAGYKTIDPAPAVQIGLGVRGGR